MEDDDIQIVEEQPKPSVSTLMAVGNGVHPDSSGASSAPTAKQDRAQGSKGPTLTDMKRCAREALERLDKGLIVDPGSSSPWTSCSPSTPPSNASWTLTSEGTFTVARGQEEVADGADYRG
jgi:hypothetical protein